MTIDSSALVAIFRNESERQEFLALINGAGRRLISTVTVLEVSVVMEGRRGSEAHVDLDEFLRKAAVEIVPFDREQLSVARMAFRLFGKGRHPAGLNFGDCAAYALSQVSGEPLLFKGTDFEATDVARARV